MEYKRLGSEMYMGDDFIPADPEAGDNYSALNEAGTGYTGVNGMSTGYTNVNESGDRYANTNRINTGYTNVNESGDRYTNANRINTGYTNVNESGDRYTNANRINTGYTNVNGMGDGYANANGINTGYMNANGMEEDDGYRNSVEFPYPGSVLGIGSQGNNVLRMQQYMNIIVERYPCIPKTLENGVYGTETQNTVLACQDQFGLFTDGIIGANTWNKLMSIYNNMIGEGKPEYPGYLLSSGSAGNDVLTVQRNLNKMAVNSLDAYGMSEDGIFGDMTKNAVMNFQRQHGLMADGNVNTTTWNKICEAVNSRGAGNDYININGEWNRDMGTYPETIPDMEEETVVITNDNAADESEIFRLINQQRANHGISPLIIDPELQNVARLKAKDMADNDYFSHTSPAYGSPFQMLSRYGIYYKSAAENIAGNSSNNNTVIGWMNSPEHRMNILNQDFNYTGIGVVNDPRYGKIYVQMFVGR